MNTTVCQHTAALREMFDGAMADAEYIEKTTGQKQKLRYARITEQR